MLAISRVVALVAVGVLIDITVATAGSPSTREIIDRYLRARGGIERIHAVRTLILRGNPRPDGRPGRFMAKARPFYYLVGEPSPSRSFAEGYDGGAWEFYGDPGLVLRTTGAPAAAARHTAYFDDALVCAHDYGWKVTSLGAARIGDRAAFQLRVRYPEGFELDVFVDASTWLVIANRKTAPIHAFGEAVTTETRIEDYRDLGGALFPMRFTEYDIATGRPLSDMSGGWATAEVNVRLPLDYFSPPPEPATPLARAMNGAFMARSIPGEALAWVEDFEAQPESQGVDFESAVEALSYQCLKNEAVETGTILLEANLRDHPRSAAAHFGLGQAYRAAGREREAIAQFRAALAVDSTYRRAADALTTSSGRRP